MKATSLIQGTLCIIMYVLKQDFPLVGKRWPPEPAEKTLVQGGEGCAAGARGGAGLWVPPARGESELKPSRDVYTKPRSASPVEQRNNSTRPGWKCGNAPRWDPNRVVHKTTGMTHQPLLPLSVQKRLLSSLFSLRKSCGRHYGA